VQEPLTKTLQARRDRTEGAIEAAQQALVQAEARAVEYAEKLREARGEVFKLREARIKQWNAERDAALDVARKAAALKVSQAKAALDAEAALARADLQASAGDLARQVVRAVLPVAAGGSR
jgi:F-type H+-transporting ATPase subunit b